MEDYNGYESVREQLILAGIRELQTHSVEDLSLRKVASLCSVSCAAPYRHFANKEDFLSAIKLYINCQWTKLRSQIMEVYAQDERRQVVEVCIAYIRFCMANPNFRSIMVMANEEEEQQNFYFSQEENLIRKYCMKRFPDPWVAEKKVFLVHCIVYGGTYMLDREHIRNSPETIKKVRAILEEELS